MMRIRNPKPKGRAMLPHVRVTRVRRVFFWIVAAAFLAILPYVFMFAFGIYLGPDARSSVVATASLEVTTVPANVPVSLNGRAPRTSPVVFDGLAAGRYAVSVSANGALPWRGTLDARPEIAYTITQLKMVSAQSPRNVLSVSTAVDTVLFRDGRSFAFLPQGEGAIVLATPRREGVATERLGLPEELAGREVGLSLLDVPGQVAVGWDAPDGTRRVLGVRASDPVLPAAFILPPRVVPASAIAVISVDGDPTESLVILEMQGVARLSASGERSTLVSLGGRLVAYGYVHDRLYLLDSAGNVFQYGAPILPPRMATMRLPADAAGRLHGMMRIIAATDDMVACISAESRMILVCTPKAGSVLDGFDGGCPGAARGEFWAWAGDTLFISRGGEPPRELARPGGLVLGVQEGFAPQHFAVETDTGLYLLPSICAQESAVRFEPLLLHPLPPAARVRACAEGEFLVQDAGASRLDVYATPWLPQ
jgi:hypothetical protein